MTPENKASILIIDDAPENLHILLDLLKPQYRVLAATTGASGLRVAGDQPRPDLILLDVMMPGLDGPSLVELVRADPELARTRLVLWSALDRAELGRRAQACGADGSIEKVAGPRAAVDQICAWLLAWDGLELR